MGVKSLWNLLSPVGRPIMLETVEGKAMAIDSSIWIYQFQATMRDKEGRALINAHVLGFLRRISKLLFYGIKPVFVFDGGAPALKRSTLNERRKKKNGAAADHVKLAEKLLAAQLRREAINHVAGPQKAGTEKKPLIDESTIYLEDIDGSKPKTSYNRKVPTPSSSTKKAKFLDHDPYRLPEVDLEEAIIKARGSNAPDPRLATEDELRAFIEEMRPEDFDVTSPAFRELPTEIQYEIVGDLRLKSRQTSYARLQNMLKNTRTPLDFSKQQIQNLRQRNALTQQLLITTDSIGSAHISIPVRIASERNKEYVLIKNEGHSGGWILGIRDVGTKEKPIIIDQDSEKEKDAENAENADSDVSSMEEVDAFPPVFPDADLLAYQREMALSGFAARNPSHQFALQSKSIDREKRKPLFEPEEEEDDHPQAHNLIDSDAETGLTLAVQKSSDQWMAAKLNSNRTVSPQMSASIPKTSSSGRQRLPATPLTPSRSHEEKVFFQTSLPTTYSSQDDISSLTPLQTVLSFANASPSRSLLSKGDASLFGRPSLLSLSSQSRQIHHLSDSDDDMEEVIIKQTGDSTIEESKQIMANLERAELTEPMTNTLPKQGARDQYSIPDEMTIVQEDLESELDMEEVEMDKVQQLMQQPSPNSSFVAIAPTSAHPEDNPSRPLALLLAETSPLSESSHVQPAASPPLYKEDTLLTWSRSQSPSANLLDESHSVRVASSHIEMWDAAQEMDPLAEEGEFANFMAQIKGRNVAEVRQEIDNEIKSLNHQRKVAMRDSEDITQQMVSQIMTMLRLFGIPYITAPMEAEAQCAELVSLGLVDGVITDDSDIFLFGAQRVFKNMFNQSKTVECFLLSDLERELGLDRDTLVRLAYLLGSDYVDGVLGVGPVVAMELLKEFPGKDGLHKFKDWWLRVQSGKDKPEDNKSKFRQNFKKRFKDLYLPSDWPNAAVRDAYYHPTVDSSNEPFKWGLPDLDALRDFFQEELCWNKSKVDELLLPIIQKMNKRNQASALNKQSNLNEFFDANTGSSAHAPRKRQAYASKRLQKVVSDFRKGRKSGSSTPNPASVSYSPSDSEKDGNPAPVKKRKLDSAASATSGVTSGKRSKGGTRRAPAKSKKGKADGQTSNQRVSSSEVDEFPEEAEVNLEVPLSVELRPRPKPKPAYKNN